MDGREVETYGQFKLRAVGRDRLRGATLYRSGHIGSLDEEGVRFLREALGIATVIDIRNSAEIADSPQLLMLGTRTIALEPSEHKRRKDVRNRLAAGVICEYGKPEERMRENYRRYAREYPLIGTALRTLAHDRTPTLIHCENGKDRSGVVCALALTIAGYSFDDVMEDYLLYNELHRESIQQEAAWLGEGMTKDEEKVLLSFLEARPSYLEAFFQEARTLQGTVENYFRTQLHLKPSQLEAIAQRLQP